MKGRTYGSYLFLSDAQITAPIMKKEEFYYKGDDIMFEMYLLLAIIFVPVIAFCLYVFNKDWKKREEYDRYRVATFKKR